MILTGHQLPAIEIDYILLTPAIAAEWLTRNEGNRREKPIKQAGMVRDLIAGEWLVTGEPFKFDRDGRLIDGQNRCRAVIKSGISIPALVIGGLDPESQGAMDSGTPRTSRDALHFAGYDNEKQINAVANIHRAWNAGLFQHAGNILSGSSRMTNRETVEYARRNPAVVSAAAEAVSLYNRGLRLPTGAIGAALIELGEVDSDACAEFFQRIVELRTSGKGDPIATLIKRVNDIKSLGSTHRTYESTALFLLFRTWNAVRAGETLQRLQVGNAESGWATIPDPR